MLRARLIAGVPGRPGRLAHRPDRGPLPRLRPRALRRRPRRAERAKRVKPGQNAANVIQSSDSRRGIDIFAEQRRAGRGRQRRRDQEDRHLARAGPLHRAPGRVRQPLHVRAPRLGRAATTRCRRRTRPTPSARARAAGRRPRTTRSRPRPPRPAASQASDAGRRPAAEDVVARASVPVKERLFAHPSVPGAREAGGLDQLLDAKARKQRRVRDLPQLLLAPVSGSTRATSGCAG